MSNYPNYEDLRHDASAYFPIYSEVPGGDFTIYLQQKDDQNFSRKLFDLKGKIWQAEALTLHELAFFAKGPVLELGCLQGASTIVLYRANRNVTTIDISMEAIEAARANFKRHNVKPTIIHADAAAGIKQLAKEGKKFAFVFVDHDHGYDSVYRACVELPSVLQEGAYLFFHDFQDLRNESGIFGVYKAVKDTLADKLDFIGLSGNGAVFRYIAA